MGRAIMILIIYLPNQLEIPVFPHIKYVYPNIDSITFVLTENGYVENAKMSVQFSSFDCWLLGVPQSIPRHEIAKPEKRFSGLCIC